MELGSERVKKKIHSVQTDFFFLELHLPRSIATSSLFCGNPGDVDVELRISSRSSSTVLGLGVMYESDEELSQ